MLGSRDQHAAAHQGGRVADLRHVAAHGVHFKVVKVRAAEDDAASGWGGNDAQVDRRAGMQSYPGTGDRLGNGLLKSH